MIIGISGKKQSGKTTIGHFLVSLFMSNLSIAEKIDLDNSGNIVVSDIYGNRLYNKAITPRAKFSQDFVISNMYDTLDKYIKVYNFADTLKQDICMNIFNMTYDQCYGSDEDKNSLTNLTWENNRVSAREAMQIIGTDMFRKLYTNVWVDCTIRKILIDKPSLAVITDCRFPNEVEAIKNAGGKVIRLTRNKHPSDHISETILDSESYDWSNFDHIIDNNNMTVYEQCVAAQEYVSSLKA